MTKSFILDYSGLGSTLRWIIVTRINFRKTFEFWTSSSICKKFIISQFQKLNPYQFTQEKPFTKRKHSLWLPLLCQQSTLEKVCFTLVNIYNKGILIFLHSSKQCFNIFVSFRFFETFFFFYFPVVDNC